MIKKSIAYFFALFLLAACDAPTTGSEIYDGDPESDEELPKEMKEKTEQERQDTSVEIDYDKQ